jgi:hypothetical protein
MRGRCYPTPLASARGAARIIAHAPARSVRRRRLGGLPARARTTSLPNLERLLALLDARRRDDGDADSFSPPHERALAARGAGTAATACCRSLRMPRAATASPPASCRVGAADAEPLAARRDGRDAARPDPARLDERESRALFASAGELFASEGFDVAWGSADRWYAARDDLQGSRPRRSTASSAAASTRWLRARRGDDRAARAGPAPAERSAARLHDHAVNEAREERGELGVNSFWLSGCGRRQPGDARDAARSRTACARRCSPPTGRRGPRPGARSTRRAARLLATRARAARG